MACLVAIPSLTSAGVLPPGLHRASVDEVVSTFCSSTPTRRSFEAPLRELVAVARSSRAVALYINGSFVSEKPFPGDVDAVIVLPRDFDTAGAGAAQLRALHRTHGFDIERVREGDNETLDYLLHDFFGHDRNNRPRGLIEVIL